MSKNEKSSDDDAIEVSFIARYHKLDDSFFDFDRNVFAEMCAKAKTNQFAYFYADTRSFDTPVEKIGAEGVFSLLTKMLEASSTDKLGITIKIQKL